MTLTEHKSMFAQVIFYKLSDLRAEVKVINLPSVYPEDKCIRFLQNGSFISEFVTYMKRLPFIMGEVIS